MKLRNRFKEEEKIRWWVEHKFCAICKSNQNCSLHHIDGTISSSIYNSIMLCHNHHREADSHNTDSPLSSDYRAKLRAYTKRHLERQGKVPDENDRNYISRYKAS